ncbi:MAG: hypothetical protein ACYCYI_06260 [Saccharofermentanales bacterium]
MNEKDLFKKTIDENIFKKEEIRNNVLDIVNRVEKKEGYFMRKKLILAGISVGIVIAISLSAYAAVDIYQYNQAESFLGKIGIETEKLAREEAKKVYKDIASDSFTYETTKDVLNDRAVEMGIEEIPQDTKAIYEAIVVYNGMISTTKITTAQILAIKAGMTFSEIIKSLGPTKDIGSGLHVLQYAVDGDKIFYLSFPDENTKCTLSGEEYVKTLVDAKQDNDDPNTFNATLTQRVDNMILVSCPTFKNFDVISLTITKDTEIVFADGTKAGVDDIKGDMTITITGEIRESYPPQGTAKKIVLK